MYYVTYSIIINCILIDKPRGALPLRQFLFVFFGRRLWYGRFLAEKEFNALRATDLREEINPPQAEQY